MVPLGRIRRARRCTHCHDGFTGERPRACRYCRARYHAECLPERCRLCGATLQGGTPIFSMQDAPALMACATPLLAIGGFVLSFGADRSELGWLFGIPVAVGARLFFAFAAPDAASPDEVPTDLDFEALLAGLAFTAACGAVAGVVLRRLSSRAAAPARPPSAPSRGTSSPCAP